MRRLLLALVVIVFVTNGIIPIVSCSSCSFKNKSNKNITNKKNIDDDNIIVNKDIEYVVKKLNGYTDRMPFTFVITNDMNFTSIPTDYIIKKLLCSLSINDKPKFRLQAKNEFFVGTKIEDNNVKIGILVLNLFFDNIEIINPATNTVNFDIKFTTNELQRVRNILNTINKNINSKYLISKLSFFIPKVIKEPIELGTIFTILSQFVSFNDLPTIIPEKYDDTDSNWLKWNNWMKFLDSMVSGLIKKTSFDNEIEFKFSHDSYLIDIRLNIYRLINELCGDIIHLHNYMLVEARNNQTNLILILIKYLFMPIEEHFKLVNDNYARVIAMNNKIKDKDINNAFSLIISNLLYGGAFFDKKNDDDWPLEIKFVYTGLGNYVLKNVNCFFLNEKNISFNELTKILLNFLNSLINCDLTKDIIIQINPLDVIKDSSLNLLRIFSNFIKLNINVPISLFFNNFIFPNLLLFDGILSGDVNSNYYKIVNGYLKVIYTLDGEKWIELESINVLFSESIKVKNIKFVIKDLIVSIISKSDENVILTVDKKLIILELDLLTDFFVN